MSEHWRLEYWKEDKTGDLNGTSSRDPGWPLRERVDTEKGRGPGWSPEDNLSVHLNYEKPPKMVTVARLNCWDKQLCFAAGGSRRALPCGDTEISCDCPTFKPADSYRSAMYSEAYKAVSDMQIISNYSKQATEWLFSWGTQTTKEGIQGQLSSGGSSGARRHRCSVNSSKQGRWVLKEGSTDTFYS